MDPCLLMPTQCFLVKDHQDVAIAVLEVPKAAALPAEAFQLTMLTKYNIDDHYSYAEWSNGEDRGNEINIEFRWKDWICDNAAIPCSVGPMVAHDGFLTLEPMSYDQALEAAVLGYLDYYRSKKVGKISSEYKLDIESIYIGKLEPDGEEVCFPGFPKEPMDSHIIPAKRISKQCPQEDPPKQISTDDQRLMEISEEVEFTEA